MFINNISDSNFDKLATVKRDTCIDIAKGIGIIFIVYGHCYPFCREFIYLFHVAFFFMASGYCYTNTVIHFNDLKNTALKKIKTLYVPYVFCNLAFLLLHNTFINIGIYTNNTDFLYLTNNAPITQSIFGYLSNKELLLGVLKVLAFKGTTQLGTATWFLYALFIIQIVHPLICIFINKHKNIFFNFEVITIAMLVIATFFQNVRVPHMFEVIRFPSTYFAFLLGAWLKKININKFYGCWAGVLSFSLLIAFTVMNCLSVELSVARIGNPFFFMVSCIAGWLLILSCSKIIYSCGVRKRFNTISYFLIQIGKNTMPILCLHVLAFKIVSYAWILFFNQNYLYLAEFHVLFEADEIWKILFLLAGVLVPLFLYAIYYNLKGIKQHPL